MITYQDYVRHMKESGREQAPIPESQWNAMSLAEKFNNVGGGIGIGADDSRYADLASRTGAEPGRAVRITAPIGQSERGSQWWTDPSRVIDGEGWSAYSDNNQSPASQARGEAGGLSERQWIALAAMVASMGALPPGVFAGGETAGAAATPGAFAGGSAGGSLGGSAMAPVGSLGSGTTLTGTGLGSSSWGALGSGTNLAGTGLVSGTGASLAGTGVSGSALVGGSGALGGLGSTVGMVGGGMGAGAAVGGGAGGGAGGGSTPGLGGEGSPGWSAEGGAPPSGSGVPWNDLIRGGLNLAGALGQPNAQNLESQQRQYNEQMWNRALQANRPNQETPWMSSSWSQDPQSGQWTQRQTINQQDQQRLDQFRNIAGHRMTDAQTPLTIDWSRINPTVGSWMNSSLGGGYLGGGR